jgi:hypothetical protein
MWKWFQTLVLGWGVETVYCAHFGNTYTKTYTGPVIGWGRVQEDKLRKSNFYEFLGNTG